MSGGSDGDTAESRNDCGSLKIEGEIEIAGGGCLELETESSSTSNLSVTSSGLKKDTVVSVTSTGNVEGSVKNNEDDSAGEVDGSKEGNEKGNKWKANDGVGGDVDKAPSDDCAKVNPSSESREEGIVDSGIGSEKEDAQDEGENGITANWKDELEDLQRYKFQEEEEIHKKEFTEEEVTAWRNTWHIFVESGDDSIPIPNPIRNFEETKFPGDILDLLDYRRGGDFENPTPIQSQGWPLINTGKNVVGIARTGSGKTLAFLLPALVRIRNNSEERQNCPTVMIQAPTRELARQIGEEALKYGGGVRVGHAFGGVDKRTQKLMLKDAQIVVGTPGRTIEQMSDGSIKLQFCNYIVLDEADRMLDLGFKVQVKKIFSRLRLEDTQLILFTATWPEEVNTLAARLFKSNWMKVRIGTPETAANHNILQRFTLVKGKFEKKDRLVELLNSREFKGKKTIIFANSISMCKWLYTIVKENNIVTAALHSGQDQSVRDLIVRDFKKGVSLRHVIATDVAQRGLHVHDIFLVINFEFPNSMEEYVHRIGRTARQGRKGVAITMFDMRTDSRHIRELVKLLKEAEQPIPKEFKIWNNNHLNRECEEDNNHINRGGRGSNGGNVFAKGGSRKARRKKKRR